MAFHVNKVFSLIIENKTMKYNLHMFFYKKNFYKKKNLKNPKSLS